MHALSRASGPILLVMSLSELSELRAQIAQK
jgi:hypothetical protein